MNKKLSFSVRIDRVTSSHTYVSIFSNMVLEEYDHEDVPRAHCGALTFTNEEVGPWINHIRPHLVLFKDLDVENDYEEYIGKA